MRDIIIPQVTKAFFRLDFPVLQQWCGETALAQVRAVAAAREIEGLTHEGQILQVSKVEMLSAKSLEKGPPIILVMAQVQYIHAVRNRQVRRNAGGECWFPSDEDLVARTRRRRTRASPQPPRVIADWDGGTVHEPCERNAAACTVLHQTQRCELARCA